MKSKQIDHGWEKMKIIEEKINLVKNKNSESKWHAIDEKYTAEMLVN